MAVLAIVLVLAVGCRLVQLSDISAAIAFGLVGGIVALFVWGFAPGIESYLSTRKHPESASQTVQFFQTFLGGDDLLRELERVVAGCVILSADLSRSGQDVRPLLIGLSGLWLDLDNLKALHMGVWSSNVEKRVTMVADQLRKADSALGERNIEITKAYLEGAVQSARAFIGELKSESPPSS